MRAEDESRAGSGSKSVLLLVPDLFTVECPSYLHELGDALHALQVRVVLCILEPAAPATAVRLGRLRLGRLRLGRSSVPVCHVPLRGYWDAPAAWRVARLARQFEATAIHGWTGRANQIACLAGWLAGTQSVTTITDWQDADDDAWPSLSGFVRRSACANLITSVGFDPSGANTFCLEGPTRPPAFEVVATESEPGVVLRESWGIPADYSIVLACARWLPENRLKDLLWAVDLLQCSREDFVFVLLGAGRQEKRLRKFAVQCTADCRTVFSSDLSSVQAWMREADIYWHPHVWQPNSYLVRLAMQHACAVLVPRARFPVGPVEHQRNGLLFDEGRREQLARLTHALLKSTSQLREMQQSAANHQWGRNNGLSRWLRSAYGL